MKRDPITATGPIAPSTTRADGRKAINLALQGGGAHGAFTWGVLDRLFEDDRLRIAAISGTSAGAMNAVVAAQGLEEGGPEGARTRLAGFWRAVSEAGRASPVRRTLLAQMTGAWSLKTSPGYLWFDALTRSVSPYALNPFDLHPLRDLLARTIDFDCVRYCSAMGLFIGATNVETGRVRVFERHEITCAVLLASAALPTLFRAVEIDGVPYWDGGLMGNPPLFPFFHGSEADDIVIVQINPVVRPGTPRTAQDIQNRFNEIAFNSALLHELRAIDFVARLLDSGALDPARYRRMHLPMIEGRRRLRPLDPTSKSNTEWAFLTHMFDSGRDAAGRWLDAHVDDLGAGSTLDARAMFQGVDTLPAPHAAKAER